MLDTTYPVARSARSVARMHPVNRRICRHPACPALSFFGRRGQALENSAGESQFLHGMLLNGSYPREKHKCRHSRNYALHRCSNYDSEQHVQHYFLIMLTSNAVVALLTWLAFEMLGLDHASVWGVAAGVLHFIPYSGTFTIALASGISGFL